ncbi:MAG: hypothetical protein WAQ08_16040 [Aquabacterium sp.]|uniref:hypothetical protein n=1 Tax=Aquabacterium sp. TaxID=1872578 RepID=UPI003BAEF617
MTVVAWDGHTLAADKLAVYGESRHRVTKIHRVRGHLVGFSGDLDRMQNVLTWFESGAVAADFPKVAVEEICGTLLVITPTGEVLTYERSPRPIRLEQTRVAIGSGREFAMGAMYQGADAIQAVRVAMALCISCGEGYDHLTLEQDGETQPACNTPAVTPQVTT